MERMRTTKLGWGTKSSRPPRSRTGYSSFRKPTSNVPFSDVTLVWGQNGNTGGTCWLLIFENMEDSVWENGTKKQ